MHVLGGTNYSNKKSAYRFMVSLSREHSTSSSQNVGERNMLSWETITRLCVRCAYGMTQVSMMRSCNHKPLAAIAVAAVFAMVMVYTNSVSTNSVSSVFQLVGWTPSCAKCSSQELRVWKEYRLGDAVKGAYRRTQLNGFSTLLEYYSNAWPTSIATDYLGRNTSSFFSLPAKELQVRSFEMQRR